MSERVCRKPSASCVHSSARVAMLRASGSSSSASCEPRRRAGGGRRLFGRAGRGGLSKGRAPRGCAKSSLPSARPSPRPR
eukprot:412717-Prymnesium_polylepis.1